MNTGLTTKRIAHWLLPEEEATWDFFVTQHPRGLIYHQTVWKRVLEQAFPHIRGRFLVLRDNSTGAIQAGLPLYLVKSWLLGNRVVSTPFASFCDPLISSGTDFEQLLPSVRELCQQTSCRRVEIRTRKIEHTTITGSLAVRSTYKHHFLPLETGLETLFQNFAKSPIRQMIAKANRARVSVKETNGSDSIEIYHDILVQTRRRLRLPPMPIRFFSAMQSHLSPHHMKTFLAFHDGSPVGCHLVLIAGDFWISEHLGKRDDAIKGVNQILYWEAIKAAHAAGAKVFSFGRTSLANEGLLVHKRRWKTIEEELMYCNVPLGTENARDTENQVHGSYSSGYRFTKFIAGIVPKFMSQRLGDFCYRHLG
jgi:hypothetical protein